MNDIPDVVPGLSLADLSPNLAGSRGRARKALAQSIRGRDILVLLSGPPGSGKSTILNATIAMLANEPIRFIRLSNPELTTFDQFDLAAGLLGVRFDGSSMDIAAEVIARISPADGESQVVIVVDDAHTLSDAAMELLLLIASPVRGSLVSPQLILAGEGEFWNREWRAEWRVITSMADHIVLEPLAGADARDYVVFEMVRSGGFATEVTNDALAMIARESNGLPARINEIIAASISIARCRATSILTGEIVDAAIATIADAPNPTSREASVLDADGGHGIELLGTPSAKQSGNGDQEGPGSDNLFEKSSPVVSPDFMRRVSEPEVREPAAPDLALLLNGAHVAVESSAVTGSTGLASASELPGRNREASRSGHQQRGTQLDNSAPTRTPMIQQALADDVDKAGYSKDVNRTVDRDREKSAATPSARPTDSGHDVSRRFGGAKALAASLVLVAIAVAVLGVWANEGMQQRITSLMGRWRTSEHPSVLIAHTEQEAKEAVPSAPQPAPGASASGATLPPARLATINTARDIPAAQPEAAQTTPSGGDVADHTPKIVAPSALGAASHELAKATVAEEAAVAAPTDERPRSEAMIREAATQPALAAPNPVNEPVPELVAESVPVLGAEPVREPGTEPAPAIVANAASSVTKEVVGEAAPPSPEAVSTSFSTDKTSAPDQPSVPESAVAVGALASPAPDQPSVPESAVAVGALASPAPDQPSVPESAVAVGGLASPAPD